MVELLLDLVSTERVPPQDGIPRMRIISKHGVRIEMGVRGLLMQQTLRILCQQQCLQAAIA
jgi:hypothetical protein